MFGRKPVRASAETGIDLDALLDGAIEREATGGKPKTPVTSRGEAMSRSVRSSGVASRSASQREKAPVSNRASREARRAAFIGKVSSRGGIPIRELRAPFAGEEDRYLLAGFIASALNAGIRKQSQEPNTIFSGTIAGRFVDPLSTFRGWKLTIGRSKFEYDASTHTHNRQGLVTPNYNFYAREDELGGGIQTRILRESTVRILGQNGAEWVEPDPANYENS